MCAVQLEALRKQLLRERDAVEVSLATNPDAAAVVELDQTRQGRVSRIDAMQQQAMAQASQESGRQRLAAIDAALARIAQGSYGDCEECGEPISPARLTVRPEARLCIECKAAGESL